MLCFGKIKELRAYLDNNASKGLVLGFVPTMGALHEGHLSLVKESKAKCDVTICSIFVNPTQFNDKKDLERYPRTLESDTKLLESVNCDILFAPEVDEMYPEPDQRKFDFGFLDKTLDGAHRPGHFNGVAQIVSKLFDAVKPHKAFFGLKDYQQVLVVKELVRQLNFDLEIVPCNISREPDGLAMSSRNVLLSKEEREAAAAIPQLMNLAKEKFTGNNKAEVESMILSEIGKNPLFKPDYFEIRNTDDLREYKDGSGEKAIALIALFCGKIRLIDNLFLN